MIVRKEIDGVLSVSGQLSEDDLRELARSGVRTILNNRPDAEEAGQMRAADGARLAAELGLAYRHLPVTLAGMGAADAAAFAAAVAASDGPVHAFCRSGARSTNLWLLGRLVRAEMTAGEARQWGVARQVDVAPALAAFERSRAG